ncbi:chromate efflux transporter [Natronospira bacteriovora]|uniref:Chromate efflux transporter n=1 Tax=Natronospira bacteriovora TaxID=3069753 RepID=A0ABU0W598_9GAMM|nr:chromate efflux transporter [Natronospira sp. AB-CW4]MDQ2069192.1 chromate efflux transporter [Natronospira sp. AB-CW4]
MRASWEVFRVFLLLGLTSFGGPIAHLGFFQKEFVERRRWLASDTYAELIALCQFLPGPASSQAGFAIGLHRAGLTGALAAWLAFTLPSAIIMIALASGLALFEPGDYEGAVRALKAAAVGVVAWAVWGMARSLTPDWQRLLIAALAVATTLGLPLLLGLTAVGQIGAIVLGALLAPLLVPKVAVQTGSPLALPFHRRGGLLAGGLFLALLMGLPFMAWLSPATWLTISDAMYRAGALVFGGGHVVLPLLHAETVATGMMDEDTFLAGYGAAQALPGPLFAFGGFVGTVAGGIGIGLLALTIIFLPGMLILLAILPFWARVRENQRLRRHLAGVNAAVVGILAAAFYDPVLTAGIADWRDGLIALAVLTTLATGRLPIWLLIIIAAGAGWFIY